MTRDTVTGGGWALWTLALTILTAVIWWLIASARRELSDAAGQIIAEAAAEVIRQAEELTRQAAS